MTISNVRGCYHRTDVDAGPARWRGDDLSTCTRRVASIPRVADNNTIVCHVAETGSDCTFSRDWHRCRQVSFPDVMSDLRSQGMRPYRPAPSPVPACPC